MKYRLTRDKVTTMTAEVEADSPEDAVRIAQLLGRRRWKAIDGGGLAEIDAVSEGGEGRCWSVGEDIDGNVWLGEVEDV